MNILHRGEGFLLAELPALENGARQLLSLSGNDVMLHTLEQGVATVSHAFNLPALRAILNAVDSLSQQPAQQ